MLYSGLDLGNVFDGFSDLFEVVDAEIQFVITGFHFLAEFFNAAIESVEEFLIVRLLGRRIGRIARVIGLLGSVRGAWVLVGLLVRLLIGWLLIGLLLTTPAELPSPAKASAVGSSTRVTVATRAGTGTLLAPDILADRYSMNTGISIASGVCETAIDSTGLTVTGNLGCSRDRRKRKVINVPARRSGTTRGEAGKGFTEGTGGHEDTVAVIRVFPSDKAGNLHSRLGFDEDGGTGLTGNGGRFNAEAVSIIGLGDMTFPELRVLGTVATSTIDGLAGMEDG
jgi:hypothetical protein